MASLKRPAGLAPEIPERNSSKEHLEDLRFIRDGLYVRAAGVRKRVRPTHSFDASYWQAASNASEAAKNLHEASLKVALQEWRIENGAGSSTGWWRSREAHDLVDKIKAATLEQKLYRQQAERVQNGGAMRRAILALFNTSRVGLGVDKSGVGKRTMSEQSKFKKMLIKAHDVGIYLEKKPKVLVDVFDSATGRILPPSYAKAAHLVPHSLGPDILIALFGSNVEGELDTPYNGLILDTCVEAAFDDGALVIVPNLPSDPTPRQVSSWEAKEPKSYKWRILDPEAESLDEILNTASERADPPGHASGDPRPTTVRDLDERPLVFRNKARPRARYLYYHFVVSQLKLAWRHKYRQNPAEILKEQIGKGVWPSRGRYMRRAFLLALAKEIGHDTDFQYNMRPALGDDDDAEDSDEPDVTGLVAIAKILQHGKSSDDEDDDS